MIKRTQNSLLLFDNDELKEFSVSLASHRNIKL